MMSEICNGKWTNQRGDLPARSRADLHST